MVTPKGKSRKLSTGEITLSRYIYKNSIDYSRVMVHNGSYFPFGLQNEDTAVTPNGEIYFMPKHFKEDFSIANANDQHWFIHEMAHVWQYQLGINVRLRGLGSWAVSYKYSLPDYRLLSDYGMEVQASILADYFYLIKFGRNGFDAISNMQGIKGPDLKRRYEWVLRLFLKDPANRRNLP
ncbi:hypothetical protein [Serratia rubidaea]|uniref:Type IV secretion protein Rhs n=1 Tax=Serratia rubidaea TaxID=61652 RepID=A0ABS0MC97_SERRU|nr:hypothetical protein [Serratia rubidaea]MBH1929892.1 hypothetical protein [Serratia rubidaea]